MILISVIIFDSETKVLEQQKPNARDKKSTKIVTA